MSVVENWTRYCADKGITFEVYSRGVDIILDGNEEYYAEVGFEGLERAIRTEIGEGAQT